ncbi:MAG: TIM44-like domain-containing protein [Fibrobacteria bacterium]
MPLDGSAARELIHWGKTIPGAFELRPSYICFAGAAVLLATFFIRLKLRVKAAEAARILAAGRDAVWNERDLKLGMEETFKEVQAAWAQGNLATLSTLLERPLHQEWEIRRAEERLVGSRQVVSGATLSEVEIVNANALLENSRDEFIARLTFNATEGQRHDGLAVKSAHRVITEYWKMGRMKNRWKIREIQRDGILVRMSMAWEPSCRELEKGGTDG